MRLMVRLPHSIPLAFISIKCPPLATTIALKASNGAGFGVVTSVVASVVASALMATTLATRHHF